MSENVLITIGFSHFCEKARWALDRSGVPYGEAKYLPVFHIPAAQRAARQTSVPILVTASETITDSTDILHFCDREGRGPRLFPEDAALLETVAAWEEDFDKTLGPAARRLAYHHILTNEVYSKGYMLEVSEGFQRRGMGLAFPLVKRGIQKSYRITEQNAARSRERIEDTSARIEDALSDGRNYLTGDHFTAADLTFAALGAPLVFPAEHGFPFPSLEGAPRGLVDLVDTMRDTKAGQYLLRLYEQDRQEVKR